MLHMKKQAAGQQEVVTSSTLIGRQDATASHAHPSCSKYYFIIANMRRFSLRMRRTLIGRRSASTPDSRGVVVR
jgi:hypothetical protein